MSMKLSRISSDKNEINNKVEKLLGHHPEFSKCQTFLMSNLY